MAPLRSKLLPSGTCHSLLAKGNPTPETTKEESLAEQTKGKVKKAKVKPQVVAVHLLKRTHYTVHKEPG